MSEFLTREQILAARLKMEEVEVPEWGGKVWVREMTAAERFAHGEPLPGEDKMTEDEITCTKTVRICAYCIVDKDGKHIFTNADVEALSEKGFTAINKVAKTAYRLSGIGGFADVAIAEAQKK